MKKTGIMTDCVCDLPEEYLKTNGIDIIYFYINTATGRFRDGYEITSGNILEYLENEGAKAATNAPEPEEYKEFFENALKQYDECIHISISTYASLSYQNAMAALELMGEKREKITVIDSKHLSTGMGHLVMKAVELRDAGKSTPEIVETVESMRSRISTTFITQNADYLYRNGRTSKNVKKLSAIFMLHPVLTLKNGRITLKTLKIGNYEKSVIRYIKSELRHNNSIDKRRLFITHAGCTVKMISRIREEVDRLCKFDEVTVTKASATVSSNCGPETIGVLFVYY